MFKLTSSLESQYLPYEYSCYDPNTLRKRDPQPTSVELPPLSVHNPPEGTESLLLFVGDYDVKGRQVFCHFMLYNIEPQTSQITLESGATALNDAKKYNFAPVCPPAGETHSYYFILFAIPRKLVPHNPEGKSVIDWKMVEVDLTKAINSSDISSRRTWIEFKFTAPSPQEISVPSEGQAGSQVASARKVSQLEERPVGR